MAKNFPKEENVPSGQFIEGGLKFDENQPHRHSRLAKWAFGIALFMVFYFFILHSVVEALLLGRQVGSDSRLSVIDILLFFILPVLGMLISLVGFLLAYKDLRLPLRNREFALMAAVINPVMIAGLLVLMILAASMR